MSSSRIPPLSGRLSGSPSQPAAAGSVASFANDGGPREPAPPASAGLSPPRAQPGRRAGLSPYALLHSFRQAGEASGQVFDLTAAPPLGESVAASLNASLSPFPKVIGGASQSLHASEAGESSETQSEDSEWEHQLQGSAHEGSEAIEMRPPEKPLGYQTTSPVKRLSADQGGKKLKDYRNAVELYHGRKRTVPPPFPSGRDLVDKNGRAANLTTWHHEAWRTWPKEAREWDNHSGEVDVIAGHVKPFDAMLDKQDAGERLFAYALGDVPVAFVRTDRRTATAAGMSPTAHPGVQGAGTALAEAAVNDSHARGLGGKLKVNPIPGAEVFYKRLGFDPKTWELDPEKSDLWQRNDGKWSYVPLDEKGYLTSHSADTNVLEYDPAANAAVLERPSSSHSSSLAWSESSTSSANSTRSAEQVTSRSGEL